MPAPTKHEGVSPLKFLLRLTGIGLCLALLVFLWMHERQTAQEARALLTQALENRAAHHAAAPHLPWKLRVPHTETGVCLALTEKKYFVMHRDIAVPRDIDIKIEAYACVHSMPNALIFSDKTGQNNSASAPAPSADPAPLISAPDNLTED